MTVIFEPLHAVVACAEQDLAQRLQQAALTLPAYRKVELYDALPDVVTHLKENVLCNLVFVSDRYPTVEIQEFLRATQNYREKANCAFVLVVSAEVGENLSEIREVLERFDGWIVEPFSAPILCEIAEVAWKIGEKQHELQHREVLRRVVKELVLDFGRLAHGRACGKDSKILRSHLRHTLLELKKQMRGDINLYHELAIECFTEVPPPRRVYYEGVSHRVKERLESSARKRREKIIEILVDSPYQDS